MPVILSSCSSTLRCQGAAQSEIPQDLARVPLKGEPNRELSLPGVADSDAEEAAEIEQGRRTKRVQIVLIVESVEDFDARF